MKKERFYSVVRAVVLTMIFAMMFSVTTFAEDISTVNNDLLTSVNTLRESKGLEPLTLDTELSGYAAIRAQEASTSWTHVRPDGTQGCDMINANKWRGENLSYIKYTKFGFSISEQQQAASIMYNNLVASPTHYDNMVFGNYTKIGISTYISKDGSGTKLTTAYMFSN
ncbi:MAG: CAP domain-containing protein [Lachnospiraceae bacterium]|nr:CAP domain-containing protein [Lachnospiraceae bacterium]